MRIVTLNEQKTMGYETVFKIQGDRKIIVTSREKLKARNIRIIQLCLMLDSQDDKKTLSYNELERNLEYLNDFEDSQMCYLIKYFKILNFEEEGVILELSEKAINIFERNKKRNIKRFLISKTTSRDTIKEMTMRRLVDWKQYEIFEKNNIITIEDLLKYSSKELLQIEGIEKETVVKIQKKLKMVNMYLKKDI